MFDTSFYLIWNLNTIVCFSKFHINYIIFASSYLNIFEFLHLFAFLNYKLWFARVSDRYMCVGTHQLEGSWLWRRCYPTRFKKLCFKKSFKKLCCSISEQVSMSVLVTTLTKKFVHKILFNFVYFSDQF